MAGHGSRFKKAGYKVPKPFIEVDNQPMISMVIDNLKPSIDHKFIFIALKEHIENNHFENILRKKTQNFDIISINKVTRGAAETVLFAADLLKNDDPLLIANCDQFVDINIDDYLKSINSDYDGFIQCMNATSKKWSYIKYDNQNVKFVAEKEVISDVATTGLYWFKKSSLCIEYLQKMVNNEIKSKGEFYVAPSYNLMIEDGYKIGYSIVGDDVSVMYGTGTPDDLEIFLSKLEVLKNYKKYI
tara:strand:- start:4933 stop:5664 length:732 start_codon:yes stop_codon:yes gene_type:complete